MYISSSAEKFERTLHQLATSHADLLLYQTEAEGYWSSASQRTLTRWNREFVKKMMFLSTKDQFIFDWILTNLSEIVSMTGKEIGLMDGVGLIRM